MNISVESITLIFYFYLMVRWQYVKRPLLFLLGAAGIVLCLLAGFFGLGDSTGVRTVGRVFEIIGIVVAFIGALGACYGAELPVKLSTMTTPPPAAK